MLLMFSSLGGCFSALDAGQEHHRPRASPENTVPLEFTYLRVGQDQHATNEPLMYTGTVVFDHCLINPNAMDLSVQGGHTVYQITTGVPAGWRIVSEWDSAFRFPRRAEGYQTGIGSTWHAVLLNETAEGNGSTSYVIHLWNQILTPEPIHRQDRWFNMTFVPYMEDTTYEEGTPC